jgi:hypothetical protein
MRIYAYKTQKPLTLNHEQGLDPQSTSNHGEYSQGSKYALGMHYYPAQSICRILGHFSLIPDGYPPGIKKEERERERERERQGGFALG